MKLSGYTDGGSGCYYALEEDHEQKQGHKTCKPQIRSQINPSFAILNPSGLNCQATAVVYAARTRRFFICAADSIYTYIFKFLAERL